MKVEKECEACGSIFYVKRYRSETAKYCSVKCRDGRNFKVVCQQCGKDFSAPLCRELTKKFCSITCYGLWQRVSSKKDYRKLSINGNSIAYHRYLMESFLGYKLPRNMHVHHKNRDVDDNRLENLEVVDVKTHGSISSSCRGLPLSSATPP